MAGEQESVAPTVEAEIPPIEPEAEEPQKIEDEPEVSDQETAGEGEEEVGSEPEEEEFEEFDWQGRTIRAPKGLKDGVMMHADYTKKTQEVAASRKEVEAYAKRVQDQAKASEEELGLRAQGISKAQELENYKKIDWDAWVQQDPVAAQQGFIRSQQIRAELDGISQTLQQRAAQRSQEAQQDIAKRLDETREFARTQIKGWTPELDVKIGEFARAQGIDDASLQAVINPKIYKILHLAYLGEQVLTKPAVPKVPEKKVVPLQTVGAKANPPARVSLADADMETYVALRKKGVGG